MPEETHRLRVIHVTYNTRPGIPEIEIYGRTDEGKSITVLYRGFKPYFHMEQNQAMLEVLKESGRLNKEILWDEITSVELEHQQKLVPCWKIPVRIPGSVKKIRERIDYQYDQGEMEGPRPRVFSADINFSLRFMYDLDLGSCIEVYGEIFDKENLVRNVDLRRYTTDLLMKAEIVAPTEDFPAKYSYLSFDIEASLITKQLLCLCIQVRRWNDEEVQYKLIGTEKGIIKQFERIVREEDPDIITGYHIYGYDIPMALINRSEANNMGRLMIGRNSNSWKAKEVKGGIIYVCAGRIIADAWYYTKKLKKPPRESLQYVAERYLGKSKLDVDNKQIDQEWAEDRNKVIEYCMVDAELPIEILDMLKVVDAFSNVATVSKLPLYTVFEGHSSRLVDSILIRRADTAGYAVPMQSRYDPDDTDAIDGALVLDYKKGIHRWVCVLDYKSLYPTTMMAHNLCFTTYDQERGTTISPIGAKFLDSEIRRGLIPTMMEDWLAERTRFKRLRDKYAEMDKDDNPNPNHDPVMYNFYNGLQNAVKVQMNSVYGLLAGSFYRFTNKQIGGSITAYGRAALSSLVEWLRERDYDVIFGDTDSVGIVVPDGTLKKCQELGSMIANQFTREGYELEFEKILKVFFTHGKKKRYYSLSVWEEGSILETPSEYSRGYEIRRTDGFSFGRDSLKTLFDIVVDGTPQEAINYALGQVDIIRNGQVTSDQLAYSKSVKPFGEYKNPDSLAQVRAAKKLESIGHTFTPYMKVPYIVTNSKANPMNVEPYVDGTAFKFTPDWDYYINKLVDILGRVTEVLGWSPKDLVLGNTQDTLDRFLPSPQVA